MFHLQSIVVLLQTPPTPCFFFYAAPQETTTAEYDDYPDEGEDEDYPPTDERHVFYPATNSPSSNREDSGLQAPYGSEDVLLTSEPRPAEDHYVPFSPQETVSEVDSEQAPEEKPQVTLECPPAY